MEFDILPTLGIVLTACGLFYAGRQFQLSLRLAKHEFMLQLFEKMDTHNDVYERARIVLINGEDWPDSPKEWIRVGRLLGLYEHIYRLVDDKIIRLDQVDRAFGYRLAVLLKIPKVSNLVYDKNGGWEDLVRLIICLEEQEVFHKISTGQVMLPV